MPSFRPRFVSRVAKQALRDRHRSDVGIYDRVVIQDILKEIAQTQQVDLNAKQKFKGKSTCSSWHRPLC